MTTESSPDLCDPSSGGSASQSPDLPHHGNQNNNNVINDCNNNDDNTAKGRSSSSSNPREKVTKTDIWCFDDAAYYGNLHQEIQKKDRKIKQKNRRQVFQQQCDAFVRMVPALRNRTSRTPLTKKEIIKSSKCNCGFLIQKFICKFTILLLRAVSLLFFGTSHSASRAEVISKSY